MNHLCKHISEQLVSTFEGEAWYGDSVRKILEGIHCEQALSHPIPSAHSIWELVRHLEAWCQFASGAVRGIPIPDWPQMPQEQDFPPIVENDDPAWKQDRMSLYTSHLALAETIEKFGDSRLEEIVPGRPYKFYRLFQSVIQHAVYHGGQIALLKKMLA
jgi:DinB superfamily